MNQYPYTLAITNTATNRVFTEDFATKSDRDRRITWLDNRGHYQHRSTDR